MICDIYSTQIRERINIEDVKALGMLIVNRQVNHMDCVFAQPLRYMFKLIIKTVKLSAMLTYMYIYYSTLS